MPACAHTRAHTQAHTQAHTHKHARKHTHKHTRKAHRHTHLHSTESRQEPEAWHTLELDIAVPTPSSAPDKDLMFALTPPGVEGIVHHAPPALHPHAQQGRRVRAVLGLSMDPRRAITPPGVWMHGTGPSLLEHVLASGDAPPILISGVSFGSQAKALPRKRPPTFNTAAACSRFVEAAAKGAHLGRDVGGPKRANRCIATGV